MYVIAASQPSAEMLAKTMLSSNGIIPSYMFSKRYAPGDTETLSFLTEKLAKSIERNIQSTEASLKKIKLKLESYKSLRENLDSLGSAQIDFLSCQS